MLNDFENRKLLYNFELQKLKKAFPNTWLGKRSNIKQREIAIIPNRIEISNGDLIDINIMNARHYYNYYLEQNKKEASFFMFWQNYLGLQIEFDWDKVLYFKLRQIKDNKIREFNFKLMHKIIPSQSNLFKWSLKNDDKCNLCLYKGTIMHMLIKCENVKPLWKMVEDIIFSVFKIQICVNENIVIIGWDIQEPTYWLINIILNFAQYTIYTNYIETSMKKGYYFVNVNRLWMNLKMKLRCYLSSKYVTKNKNTKEIEKLLELIN